MEKKNSQVKSFIYGAIGAFVGVLPISIWKTIVSWLFLVTMGMDNPFYIDHGPPIGLTLWGFVYDPWHFDIISFSVYIICTLLGGAVFGFLGSRIGLNRFQKQRDNFSQQEWKGAFWWSFLFGMFFDLIFTFIWLYPGQ